MSYTEDPEVRERYEQTNIERERWPYRETISGGGGPGCPIFYRWEILTLRGWKLMVHRFLPYAEDVDHHDHPASFLTLVLRGRYWDETPCPYDCTHETSMGSLAEALRQRGETCPGCGGGGVLWEEISAPTIRWRRGEYKHRTVTTEEGAWTVVLMMPKRRAWGFWRERGWLPWDQYVERYGAAITCPDDETEVRR